MEALCGSCGVSSGLAMPDCPTQSLLIACRQRKYPEDVAYATFLARWGAFSPGALTAKLRVVTELYIFLVSSVALVAGGVLGAFVERARARSGYLAKQYHDLLALLFALEHTAADQLEAHRAALNEAQHTALNEAHCTALRNVLKERSHIEAAVSLFGKPKVAKEVRTLYADIVQAETVSHQFDERIEKLARAFRGRPLSKLSPQKRWFR
jgi:hypothetical protein